MSTLLQAINNYIEKVSVKDYQEDSIKGSYSNLKDNLTNENCSLKIKELFMNGSYVRHTILSPLSDIDVFAVIDDTDYFVEGKEPNPQTVLRQFKDYLETISDYKGKTYQDRPCVTIDLSDKHIDVLPALRHNSILYIPNDQLDGWIVTDPISHNDRFKKLDNNYRNKLRRVVRAVKSWKRDKDIKIPSFHVEEVAMSIFLYKTFSNEEEGIRLWFDNAELYLNCDIIGSENKYQDACNACKNVKDQLNEAKNLLEDDKIGEAKKLWKEVFGPKFQIIDPEEARSFGKAISEGSLKYGPGMGLSLTHGKAIAASKGFYGEISE